MHGTGDKGQKSKKHGMILNDKLSKEDGDAFLTDFLTLMRMYNKGAWYVSFYRLGIDRLFRAFEASALKWRNLIIWKKNNHNVSNSDYQSIYEPIFYGFEDDYVPIVYGWNEEHNFYARKGVPRDVIDDVAVPSVWEIERTKHNDLHPTMKPVTLVGRTIQNSSKQRDIVLDMFLGSGTTMVAAHQLARSCYGIELDPKYCQVILDRMLQLDPTLIVKKHSENDAA